MHETPPEDTIRDLRNQLSQCRADLGIERARWRSLIEDIADEVWLCDGAGKMTLMNLGATSPMGLAEFKDLTVDEVLAEVEILYPDGRLRPPEDAPLLRSLRGEIVRGDEIMRHRRTGRLRHRRFSSAPIRDAEGAITGSIAIVHDITDVKQADLQIAQLNTKLVRRAAELKAALAHHAMELASMARLHEISTRLVRHDDLRKIQEEVLDAAIGITAAEKGTIQVLGESGRLEMAAHSGFDGGDIEWLSAVQTSLAAADGPLKRGERLIVEDVTRNPILRAAAAAEGFRDFGIHALQITPLVNRAGNVIGLLATHYTNRRRPDDYSLRLLDMLARHAAEIIMRRNAEAALRVSEAAMRAFFDRAIIGAAMLDLNGRFIYINDRYCQLTGYTREEMLAGMTPVDLTPPPERDSVRAQLDPFLRGEVAEYDSEHRYTRKDGAEIWIHATAGMIRDNMERPFRIAAIIEDITPRKRAEDDLTSVAQFANENPDPVVRIAFDGLVLYANHPAEHLMSELGWQGGEQAPPRLLALVASAREGIDNEIEIKYGKDKSIGFTCVAIRDKGYVNLYGRDTTERRQAEEALRESQRDLEAVNQTLEQRVAERTAEAEARTAQLRKLASELTRTEQRERRRFAQMLHDHLQQLLVGAKFNASILERRLADASMRRYLGYVIELLDQSIAASRSLTIELSPPVLFEGKLVAALQWLARWMEENHGLRIALTNDDEVYALDPDTRLLLFQCVRELLLNIVKHAGVNEAAIAVTRESGAIHIVVEDRGSGFDPAELKISTGGYSGLGLLNIQERLLLHGGRLEITSTPGAGTKMTLSAPLQVHAPAATPEPSATAGETHAPGAAVAPGQPVRVLIADDHAVVRDGLSQLLQSDPSVEVVGTAADGQQAIELTAALQPDVVLMDVSMPRVSGIEATRRLHRTVHIIGLSMHSQTDMAARMREAGAVDYLVKTAPPEEVITAIHNAARKPL